MRPEPQDTGGTPMSLVGLPYKGKQFFGITSPKDRSRSRLKSMMYTLAHRFRCAPLPQVNVVGPG